ncbi:MAG TPA: hypothetical protein VF274_06535 [Alphaproteobacteria bacterium]
MARSAHLKKSVAESTARPVPSTGRNVAYHGDTAGHRRILEALGAVPELGDNLPGIGATDQPVADKWPPLKTFFFILVFCSTAWATISAAVLYAFN